MSVQTLTGVALRQRGCESQSTMSASAKITIQWERPAVVADAEVTDASATAGDQSSTLAGLRRASRSQDDWTKFFFL